MSEYYPIAKIPPELENIQSSTPEIGPKPIEPKWDPPQKPSMPYDVWERRTNTFKNRYTSWTDYVRDAIGLIIVIPILLLPALALFRTKGGIVNSLIFYVIPLAIYLYVQLFKKSNEEIEYEKNVKSYQNKLKEYEKEFEAAKKEYELNLKDYEHKKKDVNSSTYINKYRNTLLKDFITSITKPEQHTSNYTKGVSENYFYRYLSKYFGDFINRKLAIRIKNEWSKDQENDLYSPDFTFYKNGLIAIDIEIDEPYVGKNGMPIHYLYADHDRDQFFIDNNWIVIRFAEEQVIKQPQNCCYFIAKIICKYTGENSYLEKFEVNNKPEEIRKWTEEEAHKLAFIKYRNKYLDSEFIESLDQEIDLSK